MPIREIHTTTIKQECDSCGALHDIPLKQGYTKSKKGPYSLAAGDVLDVKVDGETTPQTFTFNTADFADITAATAAEVVAKIAASISNAAADVDEDSVRLVSQSTVLGTTSIEVTGGTAMSKLGFDGRRYGARCLGVTKGTGVEKRTDPNVIDLPHCPECGAKECLCRTWDTCPPEYATTRFADHRRCVNALGEYLKAEGYSDPEAQATHTAETQGPPEIDPSFPPGPVTLPSAKRQSSEGP